MGVAELEALWWITKDGDRSCLALYERHYSAYRYRDGRIRKLFCGPGDKLVLRTSSGDAFFVWRKFIDDCIDERTGLPQQGINCAAFRHEGAYRGSDLILQADAIADACWADRRHYTYVNPKEVRSGLPGNCFLMARWKFVRYGKHRARTKGGKLILERIAKVEE